MFAGLPGIGVGTLFYVVVALWMPIGELLRLARGEFDAARWRRALVQCTFAVSIIASIALADRALTLVLDDGSIRSLTPARLINESVADRAPESILAAPIAASFLLLAVVLGLTELLRVVLPSGEAGPVRAKRGLPSAVRPSARSAAVREQTRAAR